MKMTKLINITGKALSGEWGNEDESGNGIPVLRTTNFTNEGVVNFDNVITRVITKKNIKEKFLKNGDIILEKSGGSDKQPVGRVVYFEGPNDTYLFNNFTGLLRVKDQTKWFSKFVFYSLYSNYRKGGTIPFENKTTGLHNLKTDDYVARYEVVDLPYEEQRIIVGTLDKAKSIIESRKQELQILDDLVKARFVEMFENSQTKSVEDVCEFFKIGPFGSALHKNEISNEGFAFVLGTDNAVKNEFAYNEIRYISEDKYHELDKYTVIPGDIIMSMMGTVGRVSVIPKNIGKAVISSHLCILRTNQELMLPEFFHVAFCKDDVIQHQIDGIHNGSIMKGFNLKIVKAFMIKCPTLKEQKAFLGFKKEVDKSKFVVQKALDEAQTLFDSLMQKYFG